MTKEEILAKWDAMTPRERDAWVARDVMGWKYTPAVIDKGRPNHHCGYDIVLGGDEWRDENDNLIYDGIPAFSEDIEAAFSVVAKIKKMLFSKRKKFLDELQTVVSMENLSTPWNAEIAWPDVFWYVEPADICKAALLAVEVEQ